MANTQDDIATLHDALEEALIYVALHLSAAHASGTPFNPRASVLNQVRDALKLVAFKGAGDNTNSALPLAVPHASRVDVRAEGHDSLTTLN